MNPQVRRSRSRSTIKRVMISRDVENESRSVGHEIAQVEFSFREGGSEITNCKHRDPIIMVSKKTERGGRY